MTAITPHPARTAPDAEVDRRFLEFVADQSQRVSLAVIFALSVLALIAGPHVPLWMTGTWLAVAVSLALTRRHVLRLLPGRTNLSLALRVQIALGLSFANGIVHGLSLVVFPLLGEADRAFQSVILLGMCTGAIGTWNGRRKMFLAYAIPTLAPLPLLWAWNPGGPQAGLTELSLAIMIGMYFWLVLGMADNAWRTFEDSVRIRFQESDLNNQLQQALTRATEASQAKTRFLAAASHDLRQPLHTIGLLVAALSLRPWNGRDKEIVNLLSQVSMALSEQLDQLLDISRLDAGVVPVERRLISLDELIRQHHSEMRGAIEEKGLEALIHCDSQIFAHTDPALLLRILRNLTENAIKFTNVGSVGIRLERRGAAACITIEDSGCGIRPEEQSKVYEEFYQVGNPERDRTRGLGLGLSIVRRLANLLHVEVSMNSISGAGTQFELQLPLSLVGPPSSRPATGGSPSPLNCHVLVLDDERTVRQGVRILLEEMGCICSEAGTTAEALTQVAARLPDIVLADMRLRGADSGILAIRAIRDLVGEVPALLVSGDTAPHRLQEAARAGVRLLHKPVSMQMLRSAIQEAIAERGVP